MRNGIFKWNQNDDREVRYEKENTFGFTLCNTDGTTVFGCTSAKGKKKEVRLNPDNPVTLTVWHYYNGAQQAAFDELVSEFNATTGREVGIYVEGFSQGSVADLEEALTKAVNEEVGAEKMPDIFSTYADTAYSFQKKGRLANLSDYFEKEELDDYIDSYVEEGYFSQDDALYLFPIAKSTEIMMLNETDWETFAQFHYRNEADGNGIV